MANPFPGIDPWMEQQWGDAHHSIITLARAKLRPFVPPDVKARVQERMYLEVGTLQPVRKVREPDPHISERGARRKPHDIAGASAIAVADPVLIQLGGDPVTEGYIEIRERHPSGRLVTVIEVLSPSNKRRGVGRREYKSKQRECLRAGVNLVEIDLLRGGRWTVFAPEEKLSIKEREAPYRVSVWRSADPENVGLYPLQLREKLPGIRIPLRESDPDVPLDLQAVIDEAHEEGEYDDTDYSVGPRPRLSPEDHAWARDVLKRNGLLD